MLTWCLYAVIWPEVFFGETFDVVVGRLAAGDVINGTGLWVGLVAVGFGLVWQGVKAARSHEDPVDRRSLAWSVGVIALGLTALHNGWYVEGDALDFHLSRVFWLGWIASNAANLWLQLRGVIGRRGGYLAGRSARTASPFSFRHQTPRRRLSGHGRPAGRDRSVAGYANPGRIAPSRRDALTRRGESQWTR